MFERVRDVLSSKNEYKRQARKRQKEELELIKNKRNYVVNLKASVKGLEKLFGGLEQSGKDVDCVVIKVKEKYLSSFMESMYNGDLSEYDIVQGSSAELFEVRLKTLRI